MILVIAAIGSVLAVAFVVHALQMQSITFPGADQVAGFDKHVVDLASAIAHAEGFDVAGSVPQRAHNPGDLGPGDTGVSDVIHAVGSDVSVLPDDQTGWDLLYKKIDRALSGRSNTFPRSLTLQQFANKYVSGGQQTADSENWAANVVSFLNQVGYSVDTSTTLAGFASL